MDFTFPVSSSFSIAAHVYLLMSTYLMKVRIAIEPQCMERRRGEFFRLRLWEHSPFQGQMQQANASNTFH